MRPSGNVMSAAKMQRTATRFTKGGFDRKVVVWDLAPLPK
jgi:hypothetical protein